MDHPVLYLYPPRNPSLSYTRQIQGIIAFILFIVITIAAPDLAGGLFVPSLGASVVVAITTIFLMITNTHLPRIVEDPLGPGSETGLRLVCLGHNSNKVLKDEKFAKLWLRKLEDNRSQGQRP